MQNNKSIYTLNKKDPEAIVYTDSYGRIRTRRRDDGTDHPAITARLKTMFGFDLPKTGGSGTLATTICGVLLLAGVMTLGIVRHQRKRPH